MSQNYELIIKREESLSMSLSRIKLLRNEKYCSKSLRKTPLSGALEFQAFWLEMILWLLNQVGLAQKHHMRLHHSYGRLLTLCFKFIGGPLLCLCGFYLSAQLSKSELCLIDLPQVQGCCRNVQGGLALTSPTRTKHSRAPLLSLPKHNRRGS